MDRLGVKVWHGDCAATEADYPEFWRILDPAEQQHALSIKDSEKHRRFVEIRARLRLLLGDAVNAAPNQLRLAKAEHGKPYLVDYPELGFNLSHSADKLAIAFAHYCDLGIDIEQYKQRQNMAGLVEKCFSDEEKHYWQQLPETEQMQAFYRFWTRKEAFVKATGRGITLGLKECAVNPPSQPNFFGYPKLMAMQTNGLSKI